jgi:DNA polymerase I-like protein with 3'-5' exonuclease and polymerase domains
LTFYIPEEYLVEASEIIINEMIDTSEFEWLSVPLSIDVSIGTMWASLEKIDTFSTDNIMNNLN